MRLLPCMIIFALLLGSRAQAQLALPPMPSLPSIKVDVSHAADHGAAKAEELVRDPFWPVGYKAASTVVAEKAVVEEESELSDADKKKVALDMQKLSMEEQAAVKATMRTGGFLTQGSVRFAIINNQIVAPGEVFTLKYMGKIHEFRVRGIKGSTIILEPKWNAES